MSRDEVSLYAANELRNKEIVDWAASSNGDSPFGEFSGDEWFDVNAFVDTHDLMEIRRIVGEVGDSMSGNEQWDHRLRFDARLCDAPEHKSELYLTLHPSSRERSHGMRLIFE